MENAFRLILASGSPRRRSLLAQAGYEFEVIVSNADEAPGGSYAPDKLAEHNAVVKARAVAKELDPEKGGPTPLVIGADTIVVHEGAVFGKPADEQEAFETLATLSGNTHQVITGVCAICGTEQFTFAETTGVVFRTLSDQKIRAYIATGEPMDKAGAYGIQGGAAGFVARIEGDYDNVVGLPVTHLTRLLDELGVPRNGSRKAPATSA